ncbi:hypothetical protein CDL12_25319 [Handroanthus impetiginosus]|uniref:RING-type E3 ubiquitin transferase n=1 Tax=Handroanthus impetiginosus TaxID=429701 RepID=A0A2G9GA43_9LAMI|nr:hypothetical protein CDL12_25319 [Handroanthus impetiginosus]
MQILVSLKSFSYTINFPSGIMNAIVEQILLFLFFINFPKTILSKNSCPSSSCGIGVFSYVPIRYPFKLQTDSSPKHCQDYIILRCSNQSRALINLPSSGEFYVTDIDYYTQKIYLSDPENCLPKRFMTNFSLSSLEAFRYENYTYYLCPRKRIMFRFIEIKCLSNSTNVTIATNSGYSSELIEKTYGCRALVSSMIPVSSTFEYDLWGARGHLQLTWDVSGCKDCEEAYGAGNSEYHGEVTVRYLPHCGHYFHVECIDQWFQKNSTCPVCRTTLFE